MTKVSIPEIKMSRDYSRFEFFQSNRPAENWVKVARSIENKDLTRFVPIITVAINKRLFIVDGQHRFMACKELGLPIYYVEGDSSELSESDISGLNVNQKNWTPVDFLNFYSTHGNEDYVRYSMALEEMKLFGIADLMRVWQYRAPAGTGHELSTTDTFRSGLLKFPEKAVYKCRKVHYVLSAVVESCHSDEVKNKSSLVAAISSLTLNDNFSHDHMADQIRKYKFLFTAQADQAHYADHLEYIYNYRKRNENKVSLRYAS